MGRASRKYSSSSTLSHSQKMLEMYRQHGWSEEALDAMFMTGGAPSSPVSRIFNLPASLLQKIENGEHLSAKERVEVLLSGQIDEGVFLKDLLEDRVFGAVFESEIRSAEPWIASASPEDELRDLFAGKIMESEPDLRAPSLLEVAAEKNPEVFRVAATRITSPLPRVPLQRILGGKHGTTGAEARNVYVRAVLDLAGEEETGKETLEGFLGILQRGGRESSGQRDELLEEELYRSALQDLIAGGLFEKPLSKKEARQALAPTLSRQVLSLALGRVVFDEFRSAFVLANRDFSNLLQKNSDWPWEGLRPLFRGEDNHSRIADLYAAHRNNRVWPTRLASRNAENIQVALQEASEKFLLGEEKLSECIFLALQKRVYR